MNSIRYIISDMRYIFALGLIFFNIAFSAMFCLDKISKFYRYKLWFRMVFVFVMLTGSICFVGLASNVIFMAIG